MRSPAPADILDLDVTRSESSCPPRACPAEELARSWNMDIGGEPDDLDIVHELTDEELIAIELAAVELGYD